MDLADPTTATLAVVDALRAAAIPAAVYGGLALAAYGEPRETKDADLAVAGTTPRALLAALERAGVVASLTFEAVRFGGNRITRVALLAAPGAHGLNVADFVEPRSERFAAAVVARALEGTLRDRPVTVVSPEDFVLLKVLSTRERDLEDAASVMRSLRAALDLALIEREAALLAAETPDCDVAARLARVRAIAASP